MRTQVWTITKIVFHLMLDKGNPLPKVSTPEHFTWPLRVLVEQFWNGFSLTLWLCTRV